MSNPPVVLGIDFGGTKIAAAVCDLTGSMLESVVVDNLGSQGARASFDHGVRTARDLLAGSAPDASVAAVGVSTFGVPFDDRVELAPAIDGWGALAIGRELRAAFPGVPVRVANDVKAAAQAETRWGALAGSDPAIYLNLGTGLAAAIVTSGQVLAGAHGAAGEIGYSLRDRADVASPGIRLEDMVSGLALPGRADSLGSLRTAAEIFEAADADPQLESLITDFVNELAFHVVNLAILIDPARIAAGGGLTRSWDRIGPQLQEALTAAVPYPTELVLGRFPHDAPLLGAVALAVDAVTGISQRAQVLALEIPHLDGEPGSVTSPGFPSSLPFAPGAPARPTRP